MHFLLLVWNVLTGLAALAALGWLLFRWLKTSEDEPGRLVFKWVLSGLVFGFIAVVLGPAMAAGGNAGVFAVPFTAVCGLLLAIIWLPNITASVSKLFSDLYTGGATEPDPQALYSIAEAKRKRGQYHEAMAEIENELAQFPNDLTGLMMLAEIQAEDLKDLAAAQSTVERLFEQEGHAPKNVAYALNRLADWHVKLGNQPDAARKTLERIIQLYPDTEEAYHATQRIAHLNPIRITEQKAVRTFTVTHHEEKLGLKEGFTGLKAAPVDYEAIAAGYISQLEQYPGDNEARLNLALLYARQFNRVDLAIEQFEQLINQAGAPAKQVVHWLNLMADLHVSVAQNRDAAVQSLQRIIDLFPGSPEAEKAQKRLVYLDVEMKGQQKGQDVQLGTYEQNIGLRGKR